MLKKFTAVIFIFLGAISLYAFPKLEYPVGDIEVSLQTKLQQEFSDFQNRINSGGEKISQNDYKYFQSKSKSAPNTNPLPVSFKWSKCAGKSVLKISKTPDFSESKTFHIQNKNCAEIFNLEVGARYYWKIETAENGVAEISQTACFRTKRSFPRWIKIDELANVRDIGGAVLKNGTEVRQGLAYRGTEFDYRVKATQAGKETFTRELKIKTDIDFRGKEELEKADNSSESMGLVRVNLPVKAYDIFLQRRAKKYIEALKIFSDASRLPAYVHCWGGADRTGTFFVLLESILGFSDEQILADFEATSLSIHGIRTRSKDLKPMLDGLKKYGKNSIAENAVAYLKEYGMKDSDISKIRSTMLKTSAR